MKRFVAIVIVGIAFAARCAGQWAVFDVANLQQSVVNYAAMVEQIAKEAEQIANQVRQIQQMEDRLKRMGNMADIKAVIGFPEFKWDLNLPTKIRVWAGRTANGRGIFGDTRGGVFRGIGSEFPDFDGGTIEREVETYKPAYEITNKVDEFKEVQADVYARREELKKAIARTSEALQAAETEAEEKKLEAILNAQYSQLTALDSEVALSAAEIQVRAAESTTISEARKEADAEARRKLAQSEASKITSTFTPQYDCLLQQVTEKRFSP
jgi:type IV secretion system protein TrbJ